MLDYCVDTRPFRVKLCPTEISILSVQIRNSAIVVGRREGLRERELRRTLSPRQTYFSELKT